MIAITVTKLIEILKSKNEAGLIFEDTMSKIFKEHGEDWYIEGNQWVKASD